MNNPDYVPDRGDIVWLNFNPQAGHEEAGKRPAVVISPKSYNAKVGLALFQPITTIKKGYPFEVTLPSGLPISGVILSDQVKTLDWRTRQVTYIHHLPLSYIKESIDRLSVLLE